MTAHKQVLDVATMILRHADQSSIQMRKKKLHKLAYYTQSWSLAALSQPAFDDDIEAWRDGPVVPNLRDQTFNESCRDMLMNSHGRDIEIDKELGYIVEMVLDQYGDLTEPEIINLTHTEHPWIEARRGLPEDAHSRIIIPKSSLSDYYSNEQTLGGFTADEIKMFGADVTSGNYVDDLDVDEYLEHLDSTFDPAIDRSANWYAFR